MKVSLAIKTLKRVYSIYTHKTMSVIDTSLVAVCQMTTNNNKDHNFETCKKLIELAGHRHAKMVFLPEACDYIGENIAETLDLAEPLDGPFITKCCQLALQNNVWLSLGGVHEKIDLERISNTHVVINSLGKIVAVYRKIHLFDVELPNQGISLKESDYVMKGMDIIPPFPSPIGKVGLAVCYDIRFPELGLILTKMGAQILTYPSAFTFPTGAAHWEVLLRARAIENQCYVVAAAQSGAHNKKRSSWGHAMVVDPWGTVIAQCSDGISIVLAEVNLSNIKSVRSSMPVWQHRRNDLYPILAPRTSLYVPQEEVYQFGQSTVRSHQVFYTSTLSIAFTNKRCVVPGHVLVMPVRSAKRLSDLTTDEVSDLFQTVQKVQAVVELVHGVSSSTISLQDGVDAGQTINHLHVHILPRRPGDFLQNDDIYESLQKHDTIELQERSDQEMAEEANILREYFMSNNQHK